MIRIFGTGPRVTQNAYLGVLEQDLRPKTSVNPRKSVKNSVSGKNDRFGTVLGSTVDHIVPRKEPLF